MRTCKVCGGSIYQPMPKHPAWLHVREGDITDPHDAEPRTLLGLEFPAHGPTCPPIPYDDEFVALMEKAVEHYNEDDV